MANGLLSLFYVFWKKNIMVTPHLYNLIANKYKSTLNEDQSVIYCHNLLTLINEFPLFPGAMVAIIADTIVEKYGYNKESIYATDL